MGTFALSCPECGKIGAAELWESGGWSYTHHRAWALNVSYDFGLVAPTTGEPPAMLACLACGAIAACTEVDPMHFFPGEPAMRPVAGGRDDAAENSPRIANRADADHRQSDRE